MDGDRPFVTDNGNYIADCRFKPIDEPHRLQGQINTIPGVVDNGLFLGIAKIVLVGTKSGVSEMKRKR
jgi:ribose 5-phosphate isomerase A